MDWDWGSHGPLNTYEKDEEEDVELEQGTSNKIWTEDKRKLSEFGYILPTKE
jgi:hypothetical protein